jgi:CDP-glycerol glycerophosphotransferase
MHCINYAEDRLLDINELLPEIDMLVNDYSTSSTDFAVLGRPQIFVMPDYEEYTSEQGFVEDYRSIMPGEEATTFDELLHLITVASSGEWQEITGRRQRFLEKYYDLSLGPSCERHHQFIRGLLRPQQRDGAAGIQ